MANSRPTANGYAPSATHLLKVSDVPAIRVPSQSRSSKPPATQLRRDSHVNAPFARSQINPTPGSQSSISETGCFSQTSCYSQSRTIAAPSYPGILVSLTGCVPTNDGGCGDRNFLMNLLRIRVDIWKLRCVTTLAVHRCAIFEVSAVSLARRCPLSLLTPSWCKITAPGFSGSLKIQRF